MVPMSRGQVQVRRILAHVGLPPVQAPASPLGAAICCHFAAQLRLILLAHVGMEKTWSPSLGRTDSDDMRGRGTRPCRRLVEDMSRYRFVVYW